ncbi:transcription repressor OFP12-like [Cucumis melo]|uniref:Transcription repressor n=2 Tax=Cucumis melo TaxID=3656 RepID=A0A1S3BH53_CUCME|nr:transcription repressor OFP12-like [Cucumis melo]
MSNLRFLNNLYSFFSKLKFSPPPPLIASHTPPSDCYFTSNPISSTTAEDCHDFFSTSSDADDSISDDLAAVLSSRRFFFSSPGRSNSIFEYSSCSRPQQPHDVVVSEGHKIRKYSMDPYADFRRSMQEMVEARELEDVRSDSEFLRELLSCYLRLNPKNTHKFIVKAFSDLVLSLLASSSTTPAPASIGRRKVVTFG